MHMLATALIVLTSGFTASAIVANLYRIGGFVPETTSGHLFRVVVLMFSGPSEIFETAIAARISGEWTALGFWLSISAVSYWSMLLGIIVIHGARNFTA
jgi:hypothetical protein